VFYLKAMHHRILGQQDSAMMNYVKTNELDTNIVDVHRNLAIYKTALKDYKGALAHLDHLTRLVPLTGGLAKFAGLLWAEARDYESAAKALGVCFKENPNDLENLKHLAIAHYNAKQYRLAIADLDWLIKLAKFDIELYVYKSDCLLMMGDTVGSIKVLKKAKQRAGFDPLLDLKLIEKQIKGKKYGRAQTELSRVSYVLANNGSHVEVRYWASLLEVRLNIGKEKFERALQQINELIKDAGERDVYLFERAKIYLATNNIDSAKTDLVKLKNKDHQPAIALWDKMKF
jgi:tetratricopeptide (TPR) repeat protein